MNFSEIKFCNKSTFIITNNRQKSDIIKNIYTKFNIKFNNKLFKFYNDKYTQNLKNNEYFINLLTQGDEYLLYLTQINNENYSLFISKNILKGYKFPKIIISYYRFDPYLYENGTIFNGELVCSYNKTWEFLIDDIYVYNGKTLFNKPYIERITQIYNILNNNYIIDNFLQICSLKVKRLFTKKDLLFIIKSFIPGCNYNIIGLNFISSVNNLNIRFYFKISKFFHKNFEINFLNHENNIENISKELLNNNFTKENNIKTNIDLLLENIGNIPDINDEIEKQYFTFLVKLTKLPNIYKLYINKNNKIVRYSIAKIDTLENAEYMRNIFKEKKEYFMECYYYKDFSKWVPNAISKNKNISDYKVISNYIQNI